MKDQARPFPQVDFSQCQNRDIRDRVNPDFPPVKTPPEGSPNISLSSWTTSASDSWFGKNHNVPDNLTSPAGPFDNWSTNQGFGYHRTRDLAGQCVSWIQKQKAIAPERPFMAYFSTGCAHAPHQPPLDWRGRNAGRFDMGWDKYRKVVPKTKKPGGPATVTMSVDGREVGATRIEEQIPMRCGTECMDVGMDCVSPVCNDYEDRGLFPFNGTIESVTFDLPAVIQPTGMERLKMATRMD